MSRYVCPGCEYVYDEAHGDPREGWPAGTPFADLDPDWCCPDCGVREAQDFVPEGQSGPDSSENAPENSFAEGRS